MRISKDPQERRSEIINIAEQLFNARGYEQTTVSDIVKQIGVAQGLFYYYFKSKEEVLEAIGDRYAIAFIETLTGITGKNTLNPPTKLQEIFRAILELTKENEGIFYTLHQAVNESIHDKITSAMWSKLIPVFTRIVQDGIDQGFFPIADAAMTVEVVFIGLERYLNRKIRECSDTPEFETQIQRAITILEQALGVPNGSLQL